MIRFFLKTRVRNIIVIIVLAIALAVYTIFMKNMIFSSQHTIKTYFFMMLLWFITLIILGMVSAVLVGDLFFKDPFWKKEDILLYPLTDEEHFQREDFKDYKYRFRILIVLLVGIYIFIFNSLSDGVFGFYDRVGLQLSQLNYDNPQKQKQAVQELYERRNIDKYKDLVLKRVKEMVSKSKYDEAKSWGIWYVREKGTIKDIEFMKKWIRDDSPIVVEAAVSGIFYLVINDAERVAKEQYQDGEDLEFLIEKEKIKRNIFSSKFEYKDIIESACNRVGYPRECLLTVAAFDGKESFKVIKNKLDDVKSYNYMINILSSSAQSSNKKIKDEIEKIFIYFYEHGTFETKCLLTIAFSRLKSLKTQKLMIDDFMKYDKKKCPRIEQENKGGDPYLLSASEYFQVKVLDSIALIEDLSLENRTFLYNLTNNKKLLLKVRSKANQVYDKLEGKVRKR